MLPDQDMSVTMENQKRQCIDNTVCALESSTGTRMPPLSCPLRPLPLAGEAQCPRQSETLLQTHSWVLPSPWLHKTGPASEPIGISSSLLPLPTMLRKQKSELTGRP